jgi:2-amino-4-hydroxy-6-hydroxymethyldihydropteridine diphosphokinase
VASVFLSIGTNLGEKKQNLENVRREISFEIGEIHLESSIYESKSWGFDANESFYNIVLEVKTQLQPEALLDACQRIEKKLGRFRTNQTGYTSRIIDIDIVYYNDTIVETPLLSIPHKLMHLRNFVLEPLCEIAPEKQHPILKRSSVELKMDCTDPIQALKRTKLSQFK